MSRKIFIILTIILLFIAIDIIGYVFIFQNKVNLPKVADIIKSNPFPVAPILPATNSSTTNQNQNDQLISSTTNNTNTDEVMPLISINPGKIASLTIFPGTGSTTKIYYLAQENGNLFELLTGNSANRLSNTTFTNIGEVFWGKDKNGLHLVMRQAINRLIKNTIGTISLANKGTSTPSDLKTDILSDNINDIAVSPKKDQLFVTTKTANGIDGYLSDWLFTTKRQIFTSPLSDWLISWPNDNIITLTSKPSSKVPGFLYFLDVKTKVLKEILNDINGLTTLTNPSGTKILYSRSTPDNFDLYLYNQTDDKSIRVSVKTLPEKCLWANNTVLYCAVPRSIPNGNYPDDWYQGKISSNDDIWKIEATTGNAFVLSNTQSDGDLINLIYDETNKQLLAIDRKTNKLKIFPIIK